jgi:hypothetical protein
METNQIYPKSSTYFLSCKSLLFQLQIINLKTNIQVFLYFKQTGITAAIDNKNGGAAASQAIQSGSANETIEQYNSNNGGSLLFGGNINTTHNANIDSATNIQSQNINQASQTNESALYESKHETIGPDYNKLMTDAAICLVKKYCLILQVVLAGLLIMLCQI